MANISRPSKSVHFTSVFYNIHYFFFSETGHDPAVHGARLEDRFYNNDSFKVNSIEIHLFSNPEESTWPFNHLSEVQNILMVRVLSWCAEAFISLLNSTEILWKVSILQFIHCCNIYVRLLQPVLFYYKQFFTQLHPLTWSTDIVEKICTDSLS